MLVWLYKFPPPVPGKLRIRNRCTLRKEPEPAFVAGSDATTAQGIPACDHVHSPGPSGGSKKSMTRGERRHKHSTRQSRGHMIRIGDFSTGQAKFASGTQVRYSDLLNPSDAIRFITQIPQDCCPRGYRNVGRTSQDLTRRDQGTKGHAWPVAAVAAR